jgi:hypothetical protein
MIKWAIWVLYSLGLLAGTTMILHHRSNPPVVLVTSRALPANWLLQPGDLVADVGNARFTRRAISKGQPLTLADLAGLPSVAPAAGYLTVVLSVEARFVRSGDINAGLPARLCAGANRLTDDVTVQTVICGQEETQCVAFVQIPEKTGGGLAEKLAGNVMTAVQPKNSDCR